MSSMWLTMSTMVREVAAEAGATAAGICWKSVFYQMVVGVSLAHSCYTLVLLGTKMYKARKGAVTPKEVSDAQQLERAYFSGLCESQWRPEGLPSIFVETGDEEWQKQWEAVITAGQEDGEKFKQKIERTLVTLKRKSIVVQDEEDTANDPPSRNLRRSARKAARKA